MENGIIIVDFINYPSLEKMFKGMQALILDCLTAGDGQRIFSRDFIGIGPRIVAGFIEQISQQKISTTVIRGEDILSNNPKSLKLLVKADIIGISAMSIDLGIVKKLYQRINPSSPKQKAMQGPEKPRLTLLGGPITNDPTILDQVPFDIAVVGEGETALHALFSDPTVIPIIKAPWNPEFLHKIPRIMYRAQGQSIITPLKEPDATVQDWFKQSTGFPEKILGYPDFSSARISVECVRGCSNYRRTALPLSVEGKKKKCMGASLQHLDQISCSVCRTPEFHTQLACPLDIPAGCGFCSTIFTFGPSRSREIAPIIAEIKFLIQHGARRIGLGGPDLLDFHRENLPTGQGKPLTDPRDPPPNLQALKNLVDQLIAIPAVKKHEVQLFIENVKANLCTDEVLDILAKLPNSIFSIGCETGSAEFANILGRPCLPQETFDAVSRAHKRGIRVHVYFIHSLPGDNVQYAAETLELMQKFAKMNVDKLTIYRFQELPGSPFFNMPSDSSEFSKEDLKMFEKVKKFAIHYNESAKMQLVGQKVTVVISEINKRNPADAIGWILEGGPKVSVRKGAKFLDQVRKVRIIRVISDKLVEADLLESI